MNAPPLPAKLPAEMPQFPPSTGQQLARRLVKLTGWKLAGDFPNVPKLVLIAAPHSSWWDGVWGVLFKLALGADIAFMAKQELFRGPLGWFLHKVGGIPIARDAAYGFVQQMTRRFNQEKSFWLGIAPEGTRKRVAKWKSGFWHIAHDAQVPILAVYFHYPEKIIGVGPLFFPSANIEDDMEKIRTFYRPWQGKHRNTE